MDPSRAGIILSCLSQFMGKYQEVHNLDSRSLSGRWDQSKCQSQLRCPVPVGCFQVTSLCFFTTSPCFLATFLCFNSSIKTLLYLAGTLYSLYFPFVSLNGVLIFWSISSAFFLSKFRKLGYLISLSFFSLIFSIWFLNVTFSQGFFPFLYWACFMSPSLQRKVL